MLIHRLRKLIEALLGFQSSDFPQQPVNILRIKAKLWLLSFDLWKMKRGITMGNLIVYPRKLITDVWGQLLPFNPGNLGNWSINGEFRTLTGDYENKVIQSVISLYHAQNSGLEGYFTSGGTEGNLYSAWIGIKYLQDKKISRSNVSILKTSLTHYSISKAADILDIKESTVKLNEQTWGMSVVDLETRIRILIKGGYTGFLIPLTLGYTSTGSDDDIDLIVKLIRKISISNTNIHFYVWIDAALSGLVLPFVVPDFAPFQYPEIKTIIVDFHKFAGVPIPAGLVLYRKQLRKLIEKPIPYLSVNDSTLLGSRSGISPVASWVAIESWGKEGFTAWIRELMRKKDFFIRNINSNNNLTIIHNTSSLVIGLVIDRKHSKIIAQLERTYGIVFRDIRLQFLKDERLITIASVFFLNKK